jgi:CheW-like domain/Histidine kinase-, DNA gyrase B-, and HSP90-like ATPase/DinB superfamily
MRKWFPNEISPTPSVGDISFGNNLQSSLRNNGMREPNEPILLEFIRYNTWANARLLEACEGLLPEQLATGGPGAYDTVARTLEHLVDSESFYCLLLTGQSVPAPFRWDDPPPVAAIRAYSEQVALWLIFRSGLSTSPIITDISGRGVGLDVVRENIERLNGWIEVESVLGRGTRFTFSLPLTVTTTLCLMAHAGGQTFGLPVSSVLRMVRVGADQIGHAEGGEAIQVDGRPVALTRLTDVLDLEPAAPARAGALLPVLVVGGGTAGAERRAAFLVDALDATQEVVVKSLPQPFERVGHISGAAILGSGEVTLILNAADLLRAGKTTHQPLKVSKTPKVAAGATPVILVADDSITTRTLEKKHPGSGRLPRADGSRWRGSLDGAAERTVQPAGIGCEHAANGWL